MKNANYLTAMFLMLMVNISALAQSEFTFVVMPDTQKLSSDEEFGDPDHPDLLANRMKAMAQWIVDKKDRHVRVCATARRT